MTSYNVSPPLQARKGEMVTHERMEQEPHAEYEVSTVACLLSGTEVVGCFVHMLLRKVQQDQCELLSMVPMEFFWVESLGK